MSVNGTMKTFIGVRKRCLLLSPLASAQSKNPGT